MMKARPTTCFMLISVCFAMFVTSTPRVEANPIKLIVRGSEVAFKLIDDALPSVKHTPDLLPETTWAKRPASDTTIVSVTTTGGKQSYIAVQTLHSSDFNQTKHTAFNGPGEYVHDWAGNSLKKRTAREQTKLQADALKDLMHSYSESHTSENVVLILEGLRKQKRTTDQDADACIRCIRDGQCDGEWIASSTRVLTSIDERDRPGCLNSDKECFRAHDQMYFEDLLFEGLNVEGDELLKELYQEFYRSPLKERLAARHSYSQPLQTTLKQALQADGLEQIVIKQLNRFNVTVPYHVRSDHRNFERLKKAVDKKNAYTRTLLISVAHKAEQGWNTLKTKDKLLLHALIAHPSRFSLRFSESTRLIKANAMQLAALTANLVLSSPELAFLPRLLAHSSVALEKSPNQATQFYKNMFKILEETQNYVVVSKHEAFLRVVHNRTQRKGFYYTYPQLKELFQRPAKACD